MAAKRRRHVPMRTCIACRQHRAKRELLRVVATPEGTVEIDPRGKRSGRGAYLCRNHQCVEGALQVGLLARALRCQVTPEQVAILKAEAREVLVEPPAADQTSARSERTTPAE